MCMKWLLIIRHVNSVEQCRTVSTVSTVSSVSTMSTVSTVSTVIARCYLHLRWYFSKEKHFCPNQPHHPPCHTSSGVHWALLDIGALSGGPWIFQVKFYPGLRKNKFSGAKKLCLGKRRNVCHLNISVAEFAVIFTERGSGSWTAAK